VLLDLATTRLLNLALSHYHSSTECNHPEMCAFAETSKRQLELLQMRRGNDDGFNSNGLGLRLGGRSTHVCGAEESSSANQKHTYEQNDTACVVFVDCVHDLVPLSVGGGNGVALLMSSLYAAPKDRSIDERRNPEFDTWNANILRHLQTFCRGCDDRLAFFGQGRDGALPDAGAAGGMAGGASMAISASNGMLVPTLPARIKSLVATLSANRSRTSGEAKLSINVRSNNASPSRGDTLLRA
jgi:hypothetical protein